MGDPGNGSRKRRRDGADQNVVVANVRKFMGDYAFEFVIIHELQQTFSHRHGSMSRVSAGCKSVRRGFRNHVQLRDREVRLSRETLHHCIESRQLFARNGPRAAGKQSDFVREEICERIRADRNSQDQSHPISPAKIMAHHHQEKCEDSQQKSCTNNSHCAPRLLIRPADSKPYLFWGNAKLPDLAPLLSISFARPRPVVSPVRVRTASRLPARRGLRARERPATRCLAGSATPGDPESTVEWFCAAVVPHTPDRSLRSATAFAPQVSAPA